MTQHTTDPDPVILAWIIELGHLELAGERTTVVLGPYSAWVLIGAVQMATRHSNFPAELKATMRQFVDQFATLFEGTPGQAVIEAGWDPAQDVPR